jgi:hypothetical protein
MSRAAWISPKDRQTVLNDLSKGFSMAETARRHKLSYESVKRIRHDHSKARNPSRHRQDSMDGIEPPRKRDELSEEACKALEDFGYFRQRYLGHISTPWQVDMANQIVALLATRQKEYVVFNAPPGAGKSTIVHDIAAWVTCRNRAIRGCFGSRTMTNATKMLLRLRRTFERTIPVKARSDLREVGLGVDADSTLPLDFGAFRSDGGEVWAQHSFVVQQDDDQAIEEKEHTWEAYGVDSGVLGNRFDVIFWDDLVDRKNVRNFEAAEALKELWDKELERRLEPGGLLVLFGQRMEAGDLYRYCLDKRKSKTSEEPKYKHVVYRAHDEEKCRWGAWEEHPADLPPWPESCLLDPYRLPPDELADIEENKPGVYRTLYQQEDVDLARVLVEPVWISGGRDREGVECPGCWDNDRSMMELPTGLVPPLVSVITADPSPSNFWAIQWWVYHPATGFQYLMNLANQVMRAPDFLDWIHEQNRFTGLLEDWWKAANALGARVRYVVVEANAAQKFLLQYDLVRRWRALRGVNIIPHTTWLNKADADYGVKTLGPEYRYGRVRLPGRHDAVSRPLSLKLVGQVTHYPSVSYDDQVMAHWFFHWCKPRLYSPLEGNPPKSGRPKWLLEEMGAA